MTKMPVLENFIPKEATQQRLFLKNYPEFDGRGIKIAVIDSDIVDKSLPGMQKTSTGLPKINNCVGKSGITVDTSTIVKSNGKNFIIGSSGRKLKIPPKFKNPSDQWHIGCTSFKKLCRDEDDDDNCEVNENYKESIATENDEIGDCIVWFNGTKWQACIDATSSTCFSNLEQTKILTNYDDEQEIAYLPNKVPYCINVFEDGNSLQVSRPPHDHGTLVTHVAAAYFPDNPESNGLAPGAQIISIRADVVESDLFKCIELEADIVNLSFACPITSSIVQIMKKMVEEYGIIITFSAGNEGPFYSSISEQCSEISDYIFSIGSIFPEEMRQNGPRSVLSSKSLYYYSSKGPLLSSGARGIDFVAPGVAITDLPKWYPNKNEYCEGTSLAAPNAAGSIACLLSALKANKIPYSPAMIKMALANTAFLPASGDKLAFGHGIIQIHDAFEFIKKSINILPMKSVSPLFLNDPKQKGIFFVHNDRNNNESTKSYYVNIYPELVKNWILECTSSGKNFITEYKIVKNNLINVKINTTFLEEGSLNYVEIHGIDSSKPSIGPLFYLPITVICPAESFIDKEIVLKPGPPVSFFFNIPSESQKCRIKITSLEGSKKIKIFLDHRQKKKDSLCWCGEHDSVRKNYDLYFTAKTKTRIVKADILQNGKLFEICISTYSYLNTSKFKLKVEFQKTE